MKPYKRLSLLLALTLLIGTLYGCGGNNSTLHDDDDDDRRPNASTPKDDPTDPNAPSVPERPDNPDNPSNPLNPANKIQMSDISSAGSFSEGYAFVQLNNNRDIYYCINKRGEIQFQLDNMQNVYSFHNGYAFVTDQSGISYLCNTDGKLISAEDLGCSSFITARYDDYILIVQTVSDFSGSTDSLGILNCNLEFIVEPSADLYKNFMRYYNGLYTHYLAGYMYNEGTCLNLLTGEENTDLNVMYKNAQVEHPSDLWVYQSYPFFWNDGATYKDNRSGEIVIDLRQYKETLYLASEFENGTASLLFRTETAAGWDFYFTIINENGAFLYDPVQINSYPLSSNKPYYVERDGDYYLLEPITKNEGEEYTLMVIGKDGTSKQFSLIADHYTHASIKDSVILVRDHKTDRDDILTFYDLNGNPLF